MICQDSRFSSPYRRRLNRLSSPYRRRLNRLSPLRSPLALLCCLLFLLVIISGCGTGEYERRLDRNLAKLRTESKFNDLYGALVLPDTPVSVRMPQIFKDPPFVPGALVDKDNKPVDPRRVKPLLSNLPGLKLTYEGFVENPGSGKTPYYCYLGAMEMGNTKLDAITGALREGLKKQDQSGLTDWVDFRGETPDGKGNLWKKLRFTNQQEFFTIDTSNQERFAPMPGVLEVYLHEEAGYCIVIVWRMPASIEQTVDLAKWAPLVAGCVSVKK